MIIILADDHYLILDGLKLLLKKSIPNAEVLLAQNKTVLFQLLRTHEVDILIQDIKFGKDHAKDFINDIKKDYENLKILILSSISDASTINSFTKKADGYILKTEPITEILKGIQSVSNNQFYLSLGAKKKVISNQYDDYIPLTSRETEVLRLIMKEQSNKQIAGILEISDKTVEMHRSNIYLKLDVNNLTGMIKKVISLDILEGY